MRGDTFVTHLSGHAKTFENFGGIRTCTDGTGLAQTVILTVSALTDTTESVTLHNALETLTFGSANNIYVSRIVEEFNCERVAEIQLS